MISLRLPLHSSCSVYDPLQRFGRFAFPFFNSLWAQHPRNLASERYERSPLPLSRHLAQNVDLGFSNFSSLRQTLLAGAACFLSFLPVNED
jgi:hypothetical protein